MKNYKIKGSGENEYSVYIGPKGEDGLVIRCDCRAGIYGRMCKHKLAVATGDPSLLLNQEDADELRETAEKISLHPIGELLIQLSETRKEHDAAKRKMDKARKDLETAMKA